MTTSDWKDALRAIKVSDPTPRKQTRGEFLAPDNMVTVHEKD